jgi:hypothetical protein
MLASLRRKYIIILIIWVAEVAFLTVSSDDSSCNFNATSAGRISQFKLAFCILHVACTLLLSPLKFCSYCGRFFDEGLETLEAGLEK